MSTSLGAQLSVAAQQGDAAAVEHLLGECTPDDANHADEKQCTPLHWACSCDEAIVARLLLADPRVSVEARSRHGVSAVHHACSANSLRVLPLLLDGSASHLVNAPNDWGEVPLHLAATAGHGSVIAELLRHGASTEAEDRWGRTPSRVATQQGLVPTALGLPQAQSEETTAAAEAAGAAEAAAVQLRPERRAMQAEMQAEFMRVQLERQRHAPATTQVQVKHMFAPKAPASPPPPLPPPPPAPPPPPLAAAAASAGFAPPGDELQQAVARRAAARAAAAGAAADAAAADAAAVEAAPPPRSEGNAPGSSPHLLAPHRPVPQHPARGGKPALSKLVEHPGDPAEVRRLLEAGEVSPHGADLFGHTALHKFSSWDKVDLVDLVLPYLDAEMCNVRAGQDKLTPLHACVDMGALRATRRLLQVASTYYQLVGCTGFDYFHRDSLTWLPYCRSRASMRMPLTGGAAPPSKSPRRLATPILPRCCRRRSIFCVVVCCCRFAAVLAVLSPWSEVF